MGLVHMSYMKNQKIARNDDYQEAIGELFQIRFLPSAHNAMFKSGGLYYVYSKLSYYLGLISSSKVIWPKDSLELIQSWLQGVFTLGKPKNSNFKSAFWAHIRIALFSR